jgi:hypothetical protein
VEYDTPLEVGFRDPLRSVTTAIPCRIIQVTYRAAVAVDMGNSESYLNCSVEVSDSGTEIDTLMYVTFHDPFKVRNNLLCKLVRSR